MFYFMFSCMFLLPVCAEVVVGGLVLGAEVMVGSEVMSWVCSVKVDGILTVSVDD